MAVTRADPSGPVTTTGAPADAREARKSATTTSVMESATLRTLRDETLRERSVRSSRVHFKITSGGRRRGFRVLLRDCASITRPSASRASGRVALRRGRGGTARDVDGDLPHPSGDRAGVAESSDRIEDLDERLLDPIGDLLIAPEDRMERHPQWPGW
jgi:hypothetical protein